MSTERVVNVDHDRCVGHGRCYLLAPAMFRPEPDGDLAEFHAGPIKADDQASVDAGDRAIANCPEFALSWREAEVIHPSREGTA